MMPAAPIEYLPTFIPNHEEVFQELLTGLAWERRERTNRSEYYCNDTPDAPFMYGYGTGARSYLPKPYHPRILQIRDALKEHTGHHLDSCFVNRYHDQHDHIGWHADDSPDMDDDRPIVTVSFGAPREIWFQPTLAWAHDVVITTTDKQVQLLEPGSACIMQAGMQLRWRHRVPKASMVVGERISLIYRGYVKP